MPARQPANPPPKSLKRLSLVLLIGYWIALFIATHAPSTPDVGGVKHADKIAHFVAYFGLAFLLGLTVSLHRGMNLALFARTMVCIAIYAVVDELIQLAIPSRSGDYIDWLADVVGAATGLGFFVVLRSVVLAFLSSPRRVRRPTEPSHRP